MTSRPNQALQAAQSRNEKILPGRQVTLSLHSMHAASFNYEEIKVTAEDLSASPLKMCGGGGTIFYQR